MLPDEDPSRGRRKKRRHRPRKPPESAARIIETAKPPVDPTKAVDEPLTAAEISEMRVHLRFLKEHRHLLGLKVNAAEDLLLNGVREPTHRGVCQHLLAKVDKSRVDLAIARLEPGPRTKLLEGIIRFSPDVRYLLSYLESLRAAARPDAPAALAVALRLLDFGSVSAAQMRRVLELIVELHDAKDRPQLLLSLLESATFQDALDKSAERLPQPLSDIVIPLRAAHAAIVHEGAANRDPGALAQGAAMLLCAHEKLLRTLGPEVRERLFDVGIELCRGAGADVARGLTVLLDAIPRGEHAYSDSALRLAGWLLASAQEREARAILTALSKDHPSFRAPGRWLQALEGPRLGGIGLTEQGKGEPDRDWFVSGLLLARQQPVWVCVGAPGDDERYLVAVEISRSLAIPGMATVLEHGRTDKGAPFLATARIGRAADELLGQKGELERREAVALASEAVRILGALGLAGVELPDAHPRRFALDGAGRLWLRDLLDAKRSDATKASAAHAALGRSFCLDVLSRASRVVLPESVSTRLSSAADCVALARVLDEMG